MIGAIVGDILGSRFEFNNTNKYDFELFTPECDYTDDTICTIAIAAAIINNPQAPDYRKYLLKWCRNYPHPMGCYGSGFSAWLSSPNPQPYKSYGNGAAMRVSPVAWAYNTPERIAAEARATASCSHNHPEGINGAQAIALAIFAARTGYQTLDEVAREYYGSDYSTHLIPEGQWDGTCQGCVPLAIHIASKSTSFEDAIRRAIAYGGDSDTLGAIVGSIAEACFTIPSSIEHRTLSYLPEEMKEIVHRFRTTFLSK